jgi:hypothetical protein
MMEKDIKVTIELTLADIDLLLQLIDTTMRSEKTIMGETYWPGLLRNKLMAEAVHHGLRLPTGVDGL